MSTTSYDVDMTIAYYEMRVFAGPRSFHHGNRLILQGLIVMKTYFIR